MTTNPTNPLDRIRGLNPADMTDEELGVAVEMIAELVKIHDGQYPYWESPSFIILSNGAVVLKSGKISPALSYDALLPIVREWVGRSPDRMIALSLGLDRALMNSLLESVQDMRRDCTDWRFDETLATSWCLLQLTPRQLAEAFVTAAREVGDG